MRRRHWLLTALYALPLVGCADLTTAPTAEVRHALAPTGKLRVALQMGNPLNVIRDSNSGELKGVGFDLGKELAHRIGVPFEPIFYPSIGTILDSGKAGAWDVAHFGFSVQRAIEFDFSAVDLEVELGYLIPDGSSISAIADVDRPGIRVAVQEKSGPDAFFTGTLKDAILVRTPSNSEAFAAVKSGKADVMGSIKPILFEITSDLTGFTVLDSRAGVDPHAMAMPKNRELGMAYLRQFVDTAKSEGLVKAAIERAGLRGVVLSPRSGTP